MARPALSDEQVQDFRARACEVSMRLFVEQGYEAFSLRTLARELGCSHTTPYRYFADKGEIFATVRAESFRRFGEFLRRRIARSSDPEVQLRRLARGYFDFAREHPAPFRVAFELSRPAASTYAFVEEAAQDAWTVLFGTVARAVEAGVLDGEVNALAHTMWAGVHGVAALELAGRLGATPGAVKVLESVTDALIRAHAPQGSKAKRGRGAR